MNPLTVIPPKIRKYVYAVIALAAIGVGAWQAADGNWTEFIAALVVALSHATAASNTDTE